MPRRLQSVLARLSRSRRRLLVVAGALLVLLASYPFWAGALGARIARSVLAGRLGVPVAIDGGRAGLGTLALLGLTVGEPERPLAAVERVTVPFSAAWGAGTVIVQGARLQVERGGAGDNLGSLVQRLAGRKAGGGGDGGGGAGRKLPSIMVKDSSLRARDQEHGAELVIGVLDVSLVPGDRLRIEARQISGTVRLRGGDRDPRFGAGVLELSAPLAGLRPLPRPEVRISEGYVQILRTLGLTGIRGTIQPRPGEAAADQAHPLVIDLAGSYGGARESLWTATGEVSPPAAGGPLELSLALRAARFSLDRIKDILPPSVLEPAGTSVDAALDLRFRAGKLGFKGGLDVTGLGLRHDALASEPVTGLNFSLKLDGAVDPAKRRLELGALEGRMRSLTGRLSGAVELGPGRFRFTDGTEMPMVPVIDLRVEVPKLPCNKLLESIPGPIVPYLQGFVMKGNFEADIRTKIDYKNLDGLELGGKVGIDGCSVLKAPDEVAALGGQEAITQIVEIPSLEKDAPPGAMELMAFAIGSENPDFVPFEKLSPHLVNSIMTTEDSGFFKHRGWVTPEFKTALRRNLAGGGFRLGASSITMQMVKNVLLSREKTLARKLQELFLVWHLEQNLPKERILELYFNAIEFGPRIYGIGAAAKHYFGKSATELGPLEAAFFSSILPSPKRRYIQYCHGQLYPPWEKYIRRIVARVHERGRLTDEEYAAVSAQTLTFDVSARPGNEQECLAWIKKITSRPEAEPPEGEN
jgi:hypothetical protein